MRILDAERTHKIDKGGEATWQPYVVTMVVFHLIALIRYDIPQVVEFG